MATTTSVSKVRLKHCERKRNQENSCGIHTCLHTLKRDSTALCCGTQAVCSRRTSVRKARSNAVRAEAAQRSDASQAVSHAATAVTGAAAAAAVMLSGANAVDAKEVDSYAGLTPCKDSKAFEKREKNEVRAINRKLKKYEEGSAPALALQKSKEQTEKRFAAYRNAGLLCGSDGLPHLIVDGNRQHLGEFVVPGLAFLYITGWIGWAGRDYIRDNKQTNKKPTEGEIIIDTGKALGFMRRALAWPFLAVKEFRSGELLRDQVTVSPR